MSDFRAIVIEQEIEGGTITAHTAEVRRVTDAFLMPGDVTVAVEYSDLNYKDGLAIAGRPGVARTSPLIPGIDLVGTVEASDDPRWSPGDRVVLNGDGIGESHHGGLAERARVRGDSLVRIPDAIASAQAAAIGTAGFTAMLSVLALERNGVDPDEVHESGSSVLVTGAAGGVGSVAIAVLAGLGYPVTASTGRPEELAGYLTDLGASTIIDRAELSDPGRPLQSQRWAGVVDAVGSHTLVNALAQTRYGGTVTACGLAQGPDLPGTVLPFILRGVTLVGINSVEAPAALRETAWRRLALDLDEETLAAMTTVIPLADAIPAAEDILGGRLRGRTVVDVRA
ncbi:MDR family oxidoreductase [Leifsonia naganoensis]|uniref:Acrylyl-CoA reductase (NADPH) n=1 Tax=Leifsonia naganoensis TaxID=150025 RepID=A0A853DPT9_9MICO|nr:MDR family oxidoreductase [Leifsonia naganoensis]NYK09633.1 acrylyl-CoA reductase (NADPH) [Leifsonia naganoensis]